MMGNTSAAADATNSNQVLAARQQADAIMGRKLMVEIHKLARGEASEVFEALKGMEVLPASLVARTMKDVNVDLSGVIDHAMALSREQEHEAERLAVNDMAKAGINPEGCLRVVTYLHRGQYNPVSSKNDTHPGEQERTQSMKQAIAASAADSARSKAELLKPSPFLYRYDNRLEVVTLYPAGRAQDRQSRPAPLDVDHLLSK